MKVIKALCNKIYVLKNGIVIEYNDSDKIFSNPKTQYTKNLISSSL